jgi:transcriptional regulator of heat shock response
MKPIDRRKIHILKLIVDEFIRTGGVTGSKSLLQKYELGVSSATVRNDMAALEKMELIHQPYNSAGRLPTTKGLRVFVDYLMSQWPEYFLEGENRYQISIHPSPLHYRLDNIIYELVMKITKHTGDISFGCFPSAGNITYVGMASFLQKNGVAMGQKALSVIELLEDRTNFLQLLQGLDINRKVSVFFGEADMLPGFASCAMIVKQVTLDNQQGYLGILGSLQMDYAFNISALKNILPS